MSIPSNNSARLWVAELGAWRRPRWQQFRSWQMERRAWGGYWSHRFRSLLTNGRDRWAWDDFRWHRFRSWLTYGRANKFVFAISVILGSVALVGLLTTGRGSAPRLLGEAFTIGVTDEGVTYVALDPEGLGEAQGGAAKDEASLGSGPSPVALFSLDTSGSLSLVGGEGSLVGNDPEPPPGPNPGPGPSPVPSPGPSPSPTPPPTRTEPPPTTTEPPPPTTTEPPPTTTEPPPTTTEPPPTTTEPPPSNTEAPEPSSD